MNEDIFFWISTFADDIDFIKLLSLEKRLNEDLTPEKDKRKLTKLRSWFPFKLHRYVKKMERVNIRDRKGSITYIDFIKPHQMAADVMYGRDHFSRSFIAVRHSDGVLAFFQRYTNHQTIWITAGTYPSKLQPCGGFNIECEEEWVDDPRLVFLTEKLKHLDNM